MVVVVPSDCDATAFLVVVVVVVFLRKWRPRTAI
jgi:hypothetical protein